MVSQAMITICAVLAAAMMMSVNAAGTPFPGCEGQKMYRLSFSNLVTSTRFGDSVPPSGLVFSPLSAVTHSNRFSLLTPRGFASNAVAEIAKTGNNTEFINTATQLRNDTDLIKSISSGEGLTGPGESASVTVMVDCARPFITAVAMVAPSPDWIVQISNFNLYNSEAETFTRIATGSLLVYDAGVDSGVGFTDPSDPSLDIPTSPQLNIAPLSEEMNDPFMGRSVGSFIIRRVD